jgi:hypothetical protein
VNFNLKIQVKVEDRLLEEILYLKTISSQVEIISFKLAVFIAIDPVGEQQPFREFGSEADFVPPLR